MTPIIDHMVIIAMATGSDSENSTSDDIEMRVCRDQEGYSS